LAIRGHDPGYMSTVGGHPVDVDAEEGCLSLSVDTYPWTGQGGGTPPFLLTALLEMSSVAGLTGQGWFWIGLFPGCGHGKQRCFRYALASLRW